MTDTTAGPTEARAGTATDAATGEDFMPLMGIDHVEYYVGNARQAAFFYTKAFGFHVTAYAGPASGRARSARPQVQWERALRCVRPGPPRSLMKILLRPPDSPRIASKCQSL